MGDEEKIREIYRRLLEKYGEPDQPENLSGVDLLIRVILSQNTNDVNRDRAFEKLEKRYDGDYRAIENADTGELADVIRVAGLGPTKAERIQEALRRVREEAGEYSIDFLSGKDVREAKKWLTSIPGIGPKSAAVVLCFGFGFPVFPVDTHVHRLSKRYGLVPGNASRKRTHEIMEEKVPDEIKYDLHILMIRHGREECTARKEDCRCELCERYRS